jgi:hypothetical protein
LVVAVMAIYLGLLVGNPNDLEGKFSAYEFSGHSKGDVLEFEDGLEHFK